MGLDLLRLSGQAFNIILVSGIVGAFSLEAMVGKYGR